MMKKTLSVALLALLMLCGCSKSFLDEKPLSSIATSEFYKSATDINAALTGMYGAFQQVLLGPNGRMIYWGEARSDNYEKNGNGGGDFNEMQLNSLTANNSFSDWSSLYRVINQANLIIKYIPQAVQLETNKSLVTPAIMNNIMAQALAMRAVCYFYIVRNWGDAVIRTTPYEDVTVEASFARSPKDDVFTKVIIPDLVNAYGLINRTATSVNGTYYIGEGAICATLNDVYMWRKDYANAIVWFKNLAKAKSPTGKIYGSGGMTLSDLQPKASWNAMFVSPSTSIESIWNLSWDFGTNTCACMPGLTATTSSTSLLVDLGIFTSWQLNTTDIRAKATIAFANTGRDRVQKYYAGVYGPSDPITGATGTYTVAAFAAGLPATSAANTYNVYPVMYRLGDQYLLYAEALNNTGDHNGAVTYLNYIRQRAGMPTYLVTDPSIATVDQLEDVILQERQWELFGEGKRWYDLVRTDRVTKIMNPVLTRRQIALGVAPSLATGWGTDLRKYLWPLNVNVLLSNGLLVQNPPYSD